MISIISAPANHQHLAQLADWFTAQWEPVDVYRGAEPGFVVPDPLLAVESDELLAGLALSRYKAVGSEQLSIWINALIVAPGHRGRGIASMLIRAAESAAIKVQAAEIFAKTDVPDLYRKLGWVDLAEEDDSFILKKVLSVGAKNNEPLSLHRISRSII